MPKLDALLTFAKNADVVEMSVTIDPTCNLRMYDVAKINEVTRPTALL